jgi:hypothetical protein
VEARGKKQSVCRTEIQETTIARKLKPAKTRDARDIHGAEHWHASDTNKTCLITIFIEQFLL